MIPSERAQANHWDALLLGKRTIYVKTVLAGGRQQAGKTSIIHLDSFYRKSAIHPPISIGG